MSIKSNDEGVSVKSDATTPDRRVNPPPRVFDNKEHRPESPESDNSVTTPEREKHAGSDHAESDSELRLHAHTTKTAGVAKKHHSKSKPGAPSPGRVAAHTLPKPRGTGDNAPIGWTNLRIGDIAPNFTAETNAGQIELFSYKKDKWCVLFSHPADFTPVCTTELGVTAALMPEFVKRNCVVLALSVDPISCHRQWAPDIGEVGGTALNFPIIADSDLIVSSLYTMIHPNEGDTSTVRSVFIISPDNKIRCILTYPKAIGRNFYEILRIIDALKCSDRAPVATPANWAAGERIIVRPDMTTADARLCGSLSNIVEVKPYLRWADLLDESFCGDDEASAKEGESKGDEQSLKCETKNGK